MSRVLAGAALVIALAACAPPRSASDEVPDSGAEVTTPEGVFYTFGAEVQKLRPNVSATTVFGTAVAIDQDTLVIGATVEANNQGRIYVFVRTGATWTLQQKLQASDATNGVRLGIQVDVSGDTLIAGAAGEAGNPQQGAAYVFTRSGTTWTQQQKIVAPDGQAADRFGQSVRIDGDTAVIGAPGDDDKGSASGSAYVFVRSGTSWTQQQKLTAADGAADDLFGYGVTIFGDTVAIGARRDDDGASDAGSVYVFVRSGTTWSQQQKLTSDSGVDGNFGRDLSLFGDSLLIGAMQRSGGNGAAYVFVRSGTTWSQQAKLTAADGANQDFFGGDVALSGDTAAVGARLDDDGAASTGSIYIFRRSGTTWSQVEKVKPSDGQFDDRFSQDMDLFGTTLVGGSRGDDDLANASGAVYVFESPLVTNGSFENDYAGWTLTEDSSDPSFGLFGIATDAQTFNSGDPAFDFADGVLLSYNAPSHTYNTTNGVKLAYHVQPNGPPTFGTHRMFQTVSIPAGCNARLRWDMEYESTAPFDPNTQFTSVNIRDASSDAILATPFKTDATSPLLVSPMAPFEADLAAFAGQTVRLDFHHEVNDAPFQIAWDNIRIACIVATPDLGVAPNPHGFGNQRVGTTSADQSFTITNTGTANLVVTSITTAAPFAVTPGALPATIAPGSTHVFAGRFSPSATGLATGSISIASNVAGSPTAIAVTGTGTAPAISVAPSSHNFGNQRVNTTSAGKTFTITNTGTAPLVISSTTTTGPFAVGATSVTVPPSGTTNVAVTFTPTALGGVGGTLQITHDAAGSPMAADLAGTGIGPVISVPASLDFGPQLVGTTSAPKTVVVDNTGSDTLTITALSLTGDYTTTTTTPITIAPGTSKSIAIALTPAATGTRTGTLTITSDAFNTPSAAVGLSGLGIQPDLSAPATLSFGEVRVGDAANQTLTVTNSGTATLTIASVTATGRFSNADSFPIAVAPGNTADLTLTFSPIATGTVTDTIAIVSDAPGSPTAVAVDGVGVEPQLATDVVALDFGLQRVGVPSLERAIVVSNPGTFPLAVSAVTVSAPFAVTSASSFVVAPGAQELVTVTFTPTAEGATAQTLTLIHDAPGSPTTIELQGVGTVADFAVAPSSLAFGSIRVGTRSATQPLTIKNLGLAPLAIASVVPTAGFTVTGATFPRSVLPGASITLEVAFTPTAPGTPAGAVDVVTSVGSTSIPLTGNGLTAALIADPPNLAFGSVEVGLASEPQTVVLTNTTDAPVSITGVVSTDPQFVLDPPPSTTAIPPHESASFAVRFAPTLAGGTQGGLQISLDADPPVDLQIAVEGDGTTTGGGCCSTGGGGSSSSLLLALAVLGVLRRRTRARG